MVCACKLQRCLNPCNSPNSFTETPVRGHSRDPSQIGFGEAIRPSASVEQCAIGLLLPAVPALQSACGSDNRLRGELSRIALPRIAGVAGLQTLPACVNGRDFSTASIKPITPAMHQIFERHLYRQSVVNSTRNVIRPTSEKILRKRVFRAPPRSRVRARCPLVLCLYSSPKASLFAFASHLKKSFIAALRSIAPEIVAGNFSRQRAPQSSGRNGSSNRRRWNRAGLLPHQRHGINRGFIADGLLHAFECAARATRLCLRRARCRTADRDCVGYRARSRVERATFQFAIFSEQGLHKRTPQSLARSLHQPPAICSRQRHRVELPGW